MELLGKSLESIMHSLPSKKMSLKSVCMIAYQMLNLIEYVHNKSFIHRDIKPDNFAVGIDEREQLNSVIYLIDFGLAKLYRNPETLVQNPMIIRKKLTGTARYASIHALMGMEQSRRDDLESIGYVIIYLLCGVLPWQGFVLKNKEDKYAKILEKKKTITSKELCKNLPKHIEIFIDYVKKLQYEEEPDYCYLKGLFEDCLKEANERFDNIYDWNATASINSNILLSNGNKDTSRREGSGHNNNTIRARATESLSFANNRTIVNNFVMNNSNTYIVNKCESLIKPRESNNFVPSL